MSSISQQFLQSFLNLQLMLKGFLQGQEFLGLAVGFGAQSLVKDIITGFFIIFEDQFSVGDYVKIGIAVGTVEEIGLRTTKIKCLREKFIFYRTEQLSEVVNYSME